VNAPEHNTGAVLLWPVAMLIVYATAALGWFAL
jgi:hypothetical protein